MTENHQNLATGPVGEGFSLRQYNAFVDPRLPLDVPTYESALPIPWHVVNCSFPPQIPNHSAHNAIVVANHWKGVQIFGLDVFGCSFP